MSKRAEFNKKAKERSGRLVQAKTGGRKIIQRRTRGPDGSGIAETR
jgi:hypothetical protein